MRGNGRFETGIRIRLIPSSMVETMWDGLEWACEYVEHIAEALSMVRVDIKCVHD